jgi:acyl-coenzyme A thioesterase PaaI-like protein
MTTAVLTTLPAGARTHMVDVHTSFARSQAADGQPLQAHAEVGHLGRRLALTTLTIANFAGELVAFGCGTAAIVGAPRA